MKHVGIYHREHQNAAIAELMWAVLIEDLGDYARARDIDRREGVGSRSYALNTPWSSENLYLTLETKTYRKPHVKIELDNLPLDLACEICALVRDRLDAIREGAKE